MILRLLRFAAVLAIISFALCGISWYFACCGAEIRPLAMKGLGDRLPVPDLVTVFTSRDELGPLARLNSAALAQVDFAEHDLVRIGWQADGPNFGTLQFAERRAGREILFYVDSPPANYRTFSRRIAEDWFIVPKEARVELSSYAHIFALDAKFWLVEGVLVVLALWIGCRKHRKRARAASPAPKGFVIAD